jgi:hypothetical protein
VELSSILQEETGEECRARNVSIHREKSRQR